MGGNLSAESRRKITALRETALSLTEDALTNGFNTDDLKTLAVTIDAIRMLFGYRSYARMAKEVGVSSRVLLDRVKRYEHPPSLFNYHRTIQGLIRICDRSLNDETEGLPDSLRSARIGWFPIPEHLHGKVVLVCELLSQIAVQIRGKNEQPSIADLLDPIDKAQLMATLETVLVLLKAPLVEVSLLRRLSRWLLSVGKSAATHGTAMAIGVLADEAGSALGKLVLELTK